MIKFTTILILIFSVLFPFSASASDFKITLKTAGHDAYPKFYYDTDQNGKRYVAGLGVEILRAIEAVDPDIEFDINPELVPWRRLQIQLENGEVDFFVGLVSNEKRRMIYDIVETPLYDLKHVVAVRTDNSFFIDSFEDFIKLGDLGAIVTLAGSGTVNYMKKQNPNLIILDQAKSIKHGLELIIRKRANFFYYHDLAIKSAILANSLEEDVKILPVSFRDYSQYAAISRKVPPRTAERLKKAIQILKINGTLERIFSKYTNKTAQQRYISGEFLTPLPN